LKVRPYKRGGWEVDIVLKLPSGEQWRERVKSPAESRSASKRWGEERASYVLANWQEVTTPKKVVPTLAEFEERFLSEYAEANRQKPSSIEAKKSILKNHLVPMLGQLKLDEIGTAQVQQLKSKLADRKPKTVNNVLNTLSVMLRIATKWGVIERMPCHVELLKAASSEMEFYDFAGHGRLVEAAAELDPRIHLLVLLGCDAGLRCGEIVALEWADIDFKRNAIIVSRSEWRGKVTIPKGGRSRRVPMTRLLAQVLQKLRHLRGARVLWREDGVEKLERPLLRKWLTRAQRKAGLRDNGGLHIMRHTFCSHLAMQGVPINAIKELAGHQDIKTTMRYMHLSPAAKESAVQSLDNRDAALKKEQAASNPAEHA
jgi:integrase